ncbi:MAG: cation:proton antiporter [Armatimonadetes bacterium]|nr:cation:proton antiporter [Armatimonadota bacterium]
MAVRFRLPALVGYLVAGMAIGPFTPGIVADSGIAQQLAEIGVSLLMFGVGLHFSIKDLWSVRKVALPGAICQILVASLLGMFAIQSWGLSLASGLVFGLSLSIASTVVLLRALTDRNEVTSDNGRIAVGWLVVEDLVAVSALVILPAIAMASGTIAPQPGANPSVPLALLENLAKMACFVGLMLIIGKKLFPTLLKSVEKTQSRELFTVGVVSIALGIAFGAWSLFGVSPALGAFFAGIVLSESSQSEKATEHILPIQEIFTVLFFVAVGMMFDPAVLLKHPTTILAAVGIVIFGKSIAAYGITLALGYSVRTGLVIAASLAQIGEFSFVLIKMAYSYNLVPTSLVSIILATAAISIAVNPLVFGIADRICRRRNSEPC